MWFFAIYSFRLKNRFKNIQKKDLSLGIYKLYIIEIMAEIQQNTYILHGHSDTAICVIKDNVAFYLDDNVLEITSSYTVTVSVWEVSLDFSLQASKVKGYWEFITDIPDVHIFKSEVIIQGESLSDETIQMIVPENYNVSILKLT